MLQNTTELSIERGFGVKTDLTNLNERNQGATFHHTEIQQEEDKNIADQVA